MQSRRRPAGGSGVTCSYGYINTAWPAASPARGSTRKAHRPRGPAANCVASARRSKPQSTLRAEDGATVSGHVIIAPRTRANPPLAHAEAGREATRVRHARRFFFYELLEKLILNSRKYIYQNFKINAVTHRKHSRSQKKTKFLGLPFLLCKVILERE